MNPKAFVASKRRRSHAPALALAMAAVSIQLNPPASRAVTTNWINNSGGSFATASNWDSGVPDFDDAAIFNRGFLAYTVTLPGYFLDPSPGNFVIDYLRVNTNEVSFVNSPSIIYKGPRGLTVANPDVSIVIGENAGEVGILNTTLNSFTAANADIARSPGATGTLNVNGGTFSISNSLSIGSGGAGTMTVQFGAVVTSPAGYIGGVLNSLGTVNLRGVGSTWTTTDLYVGSISNTGTGRLNIEDGGVLTTSHDSLVSASSIVNITGAGSRWDVSNQMLIGQGSSFNISSGGHLNAASGSIIGGASATVSGAGSAWINTGRMEVGFNGTGTLTISNGGLVSNTTANVGTSFVGVGQVTVDGAGSLWANSGDLIIGSTESGTAGSVIVSKGGAISVGGSMLVEPRGSLAGDGTLTANLINRGQVLPGFSTSGSNSYTLHVNGSYTQFNSAQLRLFLGGTADGSYGQLQVSGSTSLNGTLAVLLANYQPSAGDNFDILDWGSLSGTFSTVQLPSLPTGLSWSTGRLYTTGVISVVQSPAQWNVDASGSWNLAANWNPQIVPNHATGVANFLGKITAPRTVSLDGNKQVQQIAFDNLNSYTIAPGSGGTLTVGDGTVGLITVTSGSHEISAPLSFAGNVSKIGLGTLTISGAQNHAPSSSLKVSNGQINLKSNAGATAAGASAAIAPLAITVSSSGSITLAANQDINSLDITTSDAGAQQFNLNSPAPVGAFRALHVYASDLATAKTNLYNALRNTSSTGAPDPTDGIFDSGRGFHANSGIGLALVNDTHGDPNVFIRLTRIGDLNLDGQVTISDFIDLASHFNSPGTWQEGDLNYDGQVTISDFIDLASNFNTSYSGEVWPISPEEQQTLSSFAAAHGIAVPEPATIGSALLALLCFMRRELRYNRRSRADVG